MKPTTEGVLVGLLLGTILVLALHAGGEIMSMILNWPR